MDIIEQALEFGSWDGNSVDYDIAWCAMCIESDDSSFEPGFYLITETNQGFRDYEKFDSEADLDKRLEELDSDYQDWLDN